MTDQPLLRVRNLSVVFTNKYGTARAVDRLNFDIAPGQTLAMVGESGSGKSVSSLTIAGLSPGKIESGEILLNGEDLLKKSSREMREIRGRDIGMIFQEPMTSLNPVYTVGWQICEAIQSHENIARRVAMARALELLEFVGIPEPRARLGNFPHQLSGGMRQRVMVAIALSCSPKLLIADEPTTALDVTIQAQILDLLRRLQKDTGMSVLFITHDLGVVAEIADSVVVMYAGRAVENAEVDTIFKMPRMPYTRGLLASMPGQDNVGADGRLAAIPGNIPSPLALPAGCSFHPRCTHAVTGTCTTTMPEMEQVGPRHSVRCVRWRELNTGQQDMALAEGSMA